jgi:hypothetical protein
MENGQIIIIQAISINDCLVPLAMKTCVLFNTIHHGQENRAKIKPKRQNLTSQILPVCLPLKAGVFAVSVEKYRQSDKSIGNEARLWSKPVKVAPNEKEFRVVKTPLSYLASSEMKPEKLYNLG